VGEEGSLEGLGPENHIKHKTYRIRNKTAAKVMSKKLMMYLILYFAWIFSQMALTSLVAISGPKKVSIFQGPPFPEAVEMDMPPSKSLHLQVH
jgi:hypothetical protein